MAFTFQDFGLGLTEHVQALDRITSILQTYFNGVIWAPCIFLSVGKEIEKLRDLIEQLISESAESKTPESAIFRSDNKLAAQKAIQLAFYGVDASLSNIESTLKSAKAHRGRTEKWWTIFAKKIQFNGGDRSFLTALENFRCHTWTFALVLRILKRGDMGVLLQLAQQSNQYLDELFAELFSSTGADSMDEALTSRFAEQANLYGGTFATDFREEAVLRTSMYWTFRAIANIGQTQISKNLPNEDCLSLFKAYWILQRCREHPGAGQMPQEFQAVMVFIANELGFAAKTLLETKIELPPLESLIDCGDFRIWLEGDVEDVKVEGPTPPQTPTNLQARDYPTSQRSPVDENMDEFQIVMSNTAVHPAVYSTYEGYQDDLSQNGSHYFDSNNWGNSMSTHSQVYRKPVAVTPPASSPDSHRRASTSRSNSTKIPRYSPSISPDGVSQLRAKSLGGSITRNTTVTDAMRWGVPPVGEARPREGALYRRLPVQSKLNEPLPTLNYPPPLNSNLCRSPSSSEPSPCTISAPFSPDFVFPVSPESKGFYLEAPITETPDYGVRPGESEIMKCHSQASSTCDASSKWDDCVIRIFRNGIGDFRLLTSWEESTSIDQRSITMKESELIPEYGYHMNENLPVIFIRKAIPGCHSPQSGKQLKNMSMSPADLLAESLYYRFKTIMDMFEFQRALLGETVLADVKVVRTVRYKRGLLDGETSTNFCRVQIWKEQSSSHQRSPGSSTGVGSINGTLRARPKQSMLKPRSTRMVMFLGKILVTMFITDDITIEENIRSLTVKIKPASHGAFSGRSRSSVKACKLGDRNFSGGIRLDKEGISIDDEERFDEFKWFEIDFQTPAEMNVFAEEFRESLQERRKERKEIEELRRKAASGVRAG